MVKLVINPGSQNKPRDSCSNTELSAENYSHSIQYFYHAMHFSVKHGIAIACRLSVCLPVRLSVRL